MDNAKLRRGLLTDGDISAHWIAQSHHARQDGRSPSRGSAFSSNMVGMNVRKIADMRRGSITMTNCHS